MTIRNPVSRNRLIEFKYTELHLVCKNRSLTLFCNKTKNSYLLMRLLKSSYVLKSKINKTVLEKCIYWLQNEILVEWKNQTDFHVLLANTKSCNHLQPLVFRISVSNFMQTYCFYFKTLSHFSQHHYLHVQRDSFFPNKNFVPFHHRTIQFPLCFFSILLH